VEAKIFVSAVTREEENTLTKHYSVTGIMLDYILALLDNALCCGEKLLFLKVIVLGIRSHYRYL
jgi:hypothetical protein